LFRKNFFIFKKFVIKSFFDFTVVLFFLPLLLSIMLIIFVIILLVDGLPVFYVSKRIGLNGIKFNMIKFRTLKNNAPIVSSENFLKLKKNYYTKTGKFLKSNKLDELPQIINVLKTEMSLVGPRPALYKQRKLIELRKRKKIDLIKPGITGLAQINNYKVKTLKDKLSFDYYYLKNKSFFLDIQIILLTFKSILRLQNEK
tara:strand:+ start:357 stop:956 length:600 start_codon:yes stop_codon:yes gene_type:complete